MSLRSRRSEYESADYGRNETPVYFEHQSRMKEKDLVMLNLGRWIIVCLIGLFAGSMAFLVEWGTDQLYRSKASVTTDKITQNSLHESVHFPLFALLNLVLVGLGGVLVLFAPLAAGSGVPEIKCYLNGSKLPGLFGIKALIAKSIGVIVAVAGGMACGKEGPMIHIGANIANGVSQGRTKKLSVPIKVLNEFRNDKENRDFVAAGTGAGIAAAFGAPVGGILFALEEGASFWDQNLTFRAFLCTSVAAFMRDFLLSGAVYHMWFSLAVTQALNFGAFTEREHAGYSMAEFPFFIGLGVVGGLLGALFVSVSKRLARVRGRYLTKPWHRLLEVLVICLITSSIIFFFPLFFKSCERVKDPAGSLYDQWMKTLDCPDHSANDLASLMWNRMEHTIKMLFHSKSQFSIQSLVIATVSFFLLSVLSSGIAIPSGLFIPCLLIGALYGRMSGKLLSMWLGSDIIEGTFALIGAASFLGGVMRMNLSITVILVETTNDLSWLLPIMLAVMVSKWTGDRFNESIFDSIIKYNEIPFLEYHPSHYLNMYQAKDVMSRKVDSLPVVLRVRELIKLLSESTQDSFPVVDLYPSQQARDQSLNQGTTGSGALLGIAHRETLSTLLLHPEVFLGSAGASSGGPSLTGASTASSGGGGGGGRRRMFQALTLEQMSEHFPWHPKINSVVGLYFPHRGDSVSSSSSFSSSSSSPPPNSFGSPGGSTKALSSSNSPMLTPSSFKTAKPDFSQHLDQFVSLVPYMNRSPPLIHNCASLGQCYALFRSLGIRCLLVVDYSHHVDGMITRLDLLRFSSQHDTQGNAALQNSWLRDNEGLPRTRNDGAGGGGNDDRDGVRAFRGNDYALGAQRAKTGDLGGSEDLVLVDEEEELPRPSATTSSRSKEAAPEEPQQGRGMYVGGGGGGVGNLLDLDDDDDREAQVMVNTSLPPF